MSTQIKVIAAVGLVIALAVGFWLARPLFVDDVVDEGFPLSAGADVPPDMNQEDVEVEMAAAAAAPDVEMAEAMPEDQPVATVSGAFAGLSRYEAEGTATVYAVGGGHVLRLEDFSVTNGPDLRVLLAPIGADGQPDIAAATELDGLKGNVGNQNYEIPAGVDLAAPLVVVIHCAPFDVTFATAPLA
ncbi:hypothetical protein BH23ACT9_BH23ACT9_22970 [soil metagenome]